eukprot:GHVN01012180.1.p1 GENE.GHVN01012180.1~~GHVN01012180.1.p1  ORF type:complete len:395 (+),score=44.92 GHVN01012180.1:2365-3549(+)
MMKSVSVFSVFIVAYGLVHGDPTQHQPTSASKQGGQPEPVETEVAVVKAPLPLCNNVELELVPTGDSVNVVLDPAGFVCIMADVFTGGFFTSFVDKGFFEGNLRPRNLWVSALTPTSSPTPLPAASSPTTSTSTTPPPTASPSKVPEPAAPAHVEITSFVGADVTTQGDAALPVPPFPPKTRTTVEGIGRQLTRTVKELGVNVSPFKKTLDLNTLNNFFGSISQNNAAFAWSPLTKTYMNGLFATNSIVGPGVLAEIVKERLTSVPGVWNDRDILNAILATGSDLNETQIYKVMHERALGIRRQTEFVQNGGLELAGEFSKRLNAGVLGSNGPLLGLGGISRTAIGDAKRAEPEYVSKREETAHTAQTSAPSKDEQVRGRDAYITEDPPLPPIA